MIDTTSQNWTFEVCEISPHQFMVIARHKSGTVISKNGQQAEMLLEEVKHDAVAFDFIN